MQNELETTRAVLEEKLRKKEEEIAEIKSRHQGEVEALQGDLAKANADNEILTGKAIKKYEEGFMYAKHQFRLLDPEINLKALGAYKRIVDGELVGSDDSDSDDSKDESGDEEPIAGDPAEPNPDNEGAEIIEEVAVEDPATPRVEIQILDGPAHAEEQALVVQEAIGDEPAD